MAGAAIAVKDGQNVVVPAHSAVLLAPVSDLGQPDTPDTPDTPDQPVNPVNPDEPGDTDKSAAGEQPGNQTSGGATGPQASAGAAQQVAGIASTVSAIALLAAMAVALVAAGSGLLMFRRRG